MFTRKIGSFIHVSFFYMIISGCAVAGWTYYYQVSSLPVLNWHIIFFAYSIGAALIYFGFLGLVKIKSVNYDIEKININHPIGLPEEIYWSEAISLEPSNLFGLKNYIWKIRFKHQKSILFPIDDFKIYHLIYQRDYSEIYSDIMIIKAKHKI